MFDYIKGRQPAVYFENQKISLHIIFKLQFMKKLSVMSTSLFACKLQSQSPKTHMMDTHR